MASDAEIRLKITTDTTQASAGLKQVACDTESFGSRFKSTFAGVLAAQLVQRAASAIYDFGKQSVQAYQAAEENNARWRDSLSRIPGASDAVTNSLGAQATALSKVTTYSAGQTKAAQAALAQFGLTGDQLRQLTPLVQDYAARTGQDLPSAAESVGKALLGQGRALKSVGIDFKDTGSVAGNFAEVVTGLQDHVGGLAQTMGKTTAGQMAIFNNQVGALKVALGGLLVNAITPLLPALGAFVGFLRQYAGVIVPLVAAAVAIAAALKAWAAVQALLDMELLGGTAAIAPYVIAVVALATVFGLLYKYGGLLAVAIGGVVIALGALIVGMIFFDSIPIVAIIVAIIAAVVALVAGIYWLVSNWSTVWNAILSVVQTVWNWIASNWPLLVAILAGPIGIAVYLIVSYWNQIVAGVAWLVGAIASFFSMVFGYIASPFIAAYGYVAGILNSIAGFVAGVVARIGGYVMSVVGFFAGAFSAAYGVVAGIIGAIVGVVGGIVGRIAGAVAGVVGVLTAPFHAAQAVIEGIVNAISGAVHVVEGAIGLAKGAWNAFAHVWNAIHIDLPSIHIPLGPTIGGGTIGLPQLPTFAAGAYVTQTTLAVIHGGEFVAPEAMLRRVIRQEGASGPQVAIQNATFTGQADIDLFARRLAWILETQGVA